MTAPRNTILVGDALEQLRSLPDGYVDCVVTSPPYFQLRDYGVAGQIGLEPNVDAWVERMRAVFREVARVLKPTGSVWLNLGDTYSQHVQYGAPPKALLLAPERLITALAADGWRLRNKVVWAKTNAMPRSVTDRLTTTHELLYFMVRSRYYFFDLDTIREPHRSAPRRSPSQPAEFGRAALAGTRHGLSHPRYTLVPGHVLGRNPGDVWQIATVGFGTAHFATFPPKLVERPLLATCPERVCRRCGAPWQRERVVMRDSSGSVDRTKRIVRYTSSLTVHRELGALRPSCTCGNDTLPGLVLDPFFGTGTVGAVAQRLGRAWLGIELNAEYVALAWQRLNDAAARAAPQADAIAA